MLKKSMRWGEVPQGFEKVTDERGNLLVVRQDRRQFIDVSTCLSEDSDQGRRTYQGRAILKTVNFPDGETALIRSYQHGGFFRHLTRDCFFTWPPRPFRELTITEELRLRGIRTVEVYGACVVPLYGPIYRGWLVTKELTNSQDLWTALRGDFIDQAGLPAILKAVAVTLRALHEEGVYHSDLNLKNILVRMESNGVAGYVIDFDKARLFLGKLPGALIKRNLDRMLRSICKLDPERNYFPASAWNDFLGYYDEG
ncbi:MAG TPA: lipopolysaccharide kinase InaA family protein [Terriglobales bacterium]|nr:lipopolysaccharide kinase InaA family protein [Terriglobales bacterium]